MTFQELQIGDYFRISGISAECVYRKASNFHCSQNTLLQPIRPSTKVIVLTPVEVINYFATKQEYIKSLVKLRCLLPSCPITKDLEYKKYL